MPAARPATGWKIRAISALAYAAAAIFLMFLAIRLWRTSCEGFGCTGVGIGWLAWCVVYAAAFGIGCFACLKQLGRARRIMLLGLGLQSLAGVLLFFHWLHRGVA